MTPYAAAEVLALFEQADCHDLLSWKVGMTQGREVRLFAVCSDVFGWALADCEEIMEEDIPLLKRTLDDLRPWSAEHELPALMAARKRKVMPQNAWHIGMADQVAALFDACAAAGD